MDGRGLGAVAGYESAVILAGIGVWGVGEGGIVCRGRQKERSHFWVETSCLYTYLRGLTRARSLLSPSSSYSMCDYDADEN